MKMWSHLLSLICAVGFAAIVLIGTTEEARADCPNLPVQCGKNKVGWRGSCFKVLKGCKPCGPAHCKARPGERQVRKKLVASHAEGVACRRIIRDKVVKEVKEKKWSSSCSVPKGMKFKLANLVFGKSACLEHDICYYLRGISRKACDTAFLTNMKANCRQSNLCKLGTVECLLAANVFHRAVRALAKNKRNVSESGVCKKIPHNTSG